MGDDAGRRLDTRVALPPGVTLTALAVPHRAEWQTDTVALLIEGPSRSALYLPDIDAWDEWDHDIASVVADVDAAFLDGTFWASPTSRNVPHPPVVETVERLQAFANAGKEISFIHLNHTNPLGDPTSAEYQRVTRLGFRVGNDGEVVGL